MNTGRNVNSELDKWNPKTYTSDKGHYVTRNKVPRKNIICQNTTEFWS